MRSRCTLHINKLSQFQVYLESRGWIADKPLTDAYEVLRMRHQSAQFPCILHQKMRATEHVTSWGISQELVKDFLRSRRT